MEGLGESNGKTRAIGPLTLFPSPRLAGRGRPQGTLLKHSFKFGVAKEVIGMERLPTPLAILLEALSGDEVKKETELTIIQPMGTWAEGSFESDQALDWLEKFRANPQVGFLRATPEQVGRKPKDQRSAHEEVNAVAAADVVACWFGHAPPEPRRAGLVNWAQQNAKLAPEIIVLAQDVVRSIRTDSELKELWAGSSRWDRAMDNLEQRLQRAATD